ncbi:MAG: hypothetical protein AAFX41_03870, partial [Bacteroidota bacterium]
DYVQDVRTADTLTVRESSWMDDGSDGLVLEGHLVVAEGGVLIVEENVSVSVHGGIQIEPGGRLELKTGATLSMGAGTAIRVAGELIGDQARLGPVDPGRGWDGIQRVAQGRTAMAGVEVEGVRRD